MAVFSALALVLLQISDVGVRDAFFVSVSKISISKFSSRFGLPDIFSSTVLPCFCKVVVA